MTDSMPVPAQLLIIFYIVNQVFSALVQALPVPDGNVWYTFFYKFMSLLIADFKSFSAQMPKLPQFNSNSTGEIVTIATPINPEGKK